MCLSPWVLSQMDLVSTVGESAAVGASGVVMWGSSNDYHSKVNTGSPSRALQVQQEQVDLVGEAGTAEVGQFWLGRDSTTVADPRGGGSGTSLKINECFKGVLVGPDGVCNVATGGKETGD